MVLAPVAVSRWFASLSPTTLSCNWLLFVSAKNKPSLVHPLSAAGREGAQLRVLLWFSDCASCWKCSPSPSWCELWRFLLLVWAPRETNVMWLLCLHSLLFWVLSLINWVPGDLEREWLSLYSLFFFVQGKHNFSVEQVSSLVQTVAK